MRITGILLGISILSFSNLAFCEEPPPEIPIDNEVGLLGKNELYTTQVMKRIELGISTIDGELLRGLESEDATERQRNEAIFKGVLMRAFGFRFGEGWGSETQRGLWLAYERELVSYSWSDSPESRRTAVKRLRSMFLKE